MARIETAHHHGSHRPLIWSAVESTPSAKVDAIIVPTARPVAYLREAAAAALSLGCPLVTLHSKKWTSAYSAAAHLDPAVDLIAIDVPDTASLLLPELETSRLLAGSIFDRRTDLSTKRNLALVLSHTLRWKRIIFLDDDIRVPNPDDLSKAAGLLDAHTAVGLGIGGFSDNSMVCHAFRAVGGKQETFIGGGALAVAMKKNRSFFPNVYNEDWFFLLDAGKRLQSVATVGEVLQYRYDPYRIQRARAEELGDVLAEGIFWVLDQGKPASDGDLAHWTDFLAHRREFIQQVRSMVESQPGIDSKVRMRMSEALRAALGRCTRITPELCVAYMKALAADQEQWQRHIQQIRRQPKPPSREEALDSLSGGGVPLIWYTREATSAREPRNARSHRPIDPSLPAWRPVRAGELGAMTPSPGDLTAPRFTLTNRTQPLLPRARPTPSHAEHALETAKIALACQLRHTDGDGEGRSS